MRPLLLLLLVLPAASRLPAQVPRLSTSDQRRVLRDLASYQDAGEEERRLILLRLAQGKEAVRLYLSGQLEANPARSEVASILASLDHLEGLDLLKRAQKPPPSPWSLWVVSAGEVLIVKGTDTWVALQVDPGLDPSAPSLTVHLAQSRDPLLSMGGPGVERSTLVVEGRSVAVPSGKAFAYPPRDHAFQLLGTEVVLRRSGTRAIRWRHHAGSLPVARTGQHDFRRVKPADPSLVFHDDVQPAVAADCRRVQQYLFRIVPGLSPLPTYETPDEARYAHAEQVQVEVREELAGRLCLLVSFPHSHDLAFDEGTSFLLHRFVERLQHCTPAKVLVWLGQSEAHEANRFWNGKEFGSPSRELVQHLRQLFPEDF